MTEVRPRPVCDLVKEFQQYLTGSFYEPLGIALQAVWHLKKGRALKLNIFMEEEASRKI